MKQPDKHPAMIVHERRSFKAEPPLVRLRRSFLTPRELYSRNHGSIPDVDPDGYRFSAGGLVDGSLELSMEDLRERQKREVTAVMEFAGNRRDDPWAWSLREATLELGPGELRIDARDLDSSAATQSATAAEVWNFEGYANNSWHGVKVTVR